MTEEAPKSLLEWTPISDRIITARFWSKYTKTIMIQVYAHTTIQTKMTKMYFYEQLQMVIDKIPCHDATLLIGYLNAKIGSKLEDGLVGRHGVQNEEGKVCLILWTKQPCHNNNYVPSQRHPSTHMDIIKQLI